jgi:membrane protease YdiL (CAAX protease family)
MTMTTTQASPVSVGLEADTTATTGLLATDHVRRAATFVGLTVAAAVGSAAAAAAGVVPALLPFALAVTPAVVALGLARREGHGAARRLLRSAVTGPTDARWYLALLVPILGTLAVIPLAVALGEPATNLFAKAVPGIFIVPLVVLIPAFTEELGWRGYALPRLGTAVSPLAAGLILGVPWALLHLALFLPGQMYEGIPIWPSLVGVMSLSVLGAWVYVHTGGSVLMTGLFHALFNGATPLMSGVDTDVTWQLRALVFAGIAVAVVAFGGFRGTTLRGNRSI